MKLLRENKRGFRTEDIPKNRLQLFKLIVKDYPAAIVGINFALIAIYFLALFWGTTGLYYIYVQYLDSGMKITEVLSLLGTFVVVMIPCIFVTGPFAGAISLVIRNLARDDARNTREYFKLGLSSWRQSLMLSFISSVIPLLVWCAFFYYLPLASSSKYYVLPLTLTVCICIFVLMTIPTLYIMTITYDLSIFQHIKNAVILTVTHLPIVILVNYLTTLPLIILLFFAIIGGKVFVAVSFIVFVYYFFVGFALSALAKISLANKLCEETLNKQLNINTRIGMTP